ncbi:MAG: imidazoleglycerol-phosphate dehydratase HisB [Anaerolineae bacterium]|nr:imidazoleglycerol-phosphate dehydratase HisB [Anaerolineae bacterium]
MGKTREIRFAHIERKTTETTIDITLDLDGTGEAEVSTGIGFLDHMLHHMAVHGMFGLGVKARGDLHIDAHHTVEDVAIALGRAIDQALGERKGINRVGSAYFPMDDVLVRVVIDLSGRPYAVVDAGFTAPMLGTMPSVLVPHILQTLSVHGRMNLHAHVLYGRDDHHKAEALFKAFGRALCEAVTIDPRRMNKIASTKETLTA